MQCAMCNVPMFIRLRFIQLPLLKHLLSFQPLHKHDTNNSRFGQPLAAGACSVQRAGASRCRAASCLHMPCSSRSSALSMEGLAWQSGRRYRGNVVGARGSQQRCTRPPICVQSASRATETNWQKRTHGNKVRHANVQAFRFQATYSVFSRE